MRLVILAAILLAVVPAMAADIDLATAVVRVHDGDTVRINGVLYRLDDVNAPELVGGCVAERRLASLARRRLAALSQTEGAVFHETSCVGSNFGRKCGKVLLKGVSVAKSMVRDGYADAYQCNTLGCPKRRDWCAASRSLRRG